MRFALSLYLWHPFRGACHAHFSLADGVAFLEVLAKQGSGLGKCSMNHGILLLAVSCSLDHLVVSVPGQLAGAIHPEELPVD